MSNTTGSWLLEVLQYCTSGFWVFVGCFLLIFIFLQFILKMWAVFMIGMSDPNKHGSLNKSSELVEIPDDEEEKEKS